MFLGGIYMYVCGCVCVHPCIQHMSMCGAISVVRGHPRALLPAFSFEVGSLDGQSCVR